MPTFEEVSDFVREQTCHRGLLTQSTSLQSDIGMYGDDLFDFVDVYSKRFQVDTSSFLWYFHSGEEGSFNPGALLCPSPSMRVAEIPITIGMLHEFAEAGRWALEYPQHQIPRHRVDLWINLVCIVLALRRAASDGLPLGFPS